MDAEKLKVLKELLDSGIITQEEFDAKKKELLKLTAEEFTAQNENIPANDNPPVNQPQPVGGENTVPASPHRSNKSKKTIAFICVCVVFVVALGALRIFYHPEQQPSQQSSQPSSQQSSQPTSKAPTSSSGSSNTFSEENVKKPSYKTLAFGDSVSLDFVEITIDGASYAQEVLPDNPSRVYSYLADVAGETFVYAYGTIKNKSGNQYEFASNMYAEITFDDKYNYYASVKADEDGSLSYIYAYLDPLKSVKFYIVASVPDEIANSFKLADIKFGFADNFNGAYAIQENECDYLYSVPVSR